MRNYVLITLFLMLSFNIIKAQNDCDSKILKNELLMELRPDYRYDKSKISEITIKNVTQGGEIGVPILNTEKYRLLFNTTGFPANINIKVYDKEKGKENRTLLYSNEEEKNAGKTVFMFVPPSSKSFKIVYIDYIIPAVTDEAKIGAKGCVVFLMGYKIG